MDSQILYKYRSINCRSLSMLKSREFYFSDPKHFNDPVDCQIDIYNALKVAVSSAKKEDSKVKSKLNNLKSLEKILRKIENDVKRLAVFSLSKEENNVLMWSHYADNHKGFSAGFCLSDRFTKHNEHNAIIGTEEVHYSQDNPFIEFFLEFANLSEIPEWGEFWIPLLSMGLVAKSDSWKYENEVRIIRGTPGKAQFSPDELKVIIFGLSMEQKNRQKIRKLLSGEKWKHIQMREVVREYDGFKLKVVNC